MQYLEPDIAGTAAEGDTVGARLARQVASTPDAVAVECGPQSLTHAELENGRSTHPMISKNPT